MDQEREAGDARELRDLLREVLRAQEQILRRLEKLEEALLDRDRR